MRKMFTADKTIKQITPFLPTILYFVTILLIKPWGNFLVNDDWIFVRQVEAFSLGIWRMSTLIDPSFILQGVLGYVWGMFFGVTFDSLRILTMLLHGFTGIIFFKTAQLLKLSARSSLLFSLLFVFNPVLYTSSMSFMTETYFLFFFLLAIYFELKNLANFSSLNFWLAGLLACSSVLVREFGFTLVFAHVAVGVYFHKKNLLKTRDLMFNLFPIVLIGVVLAVWPKYPVPTQFWANFFTDKIWMIIFLPIYIAAFSFPILASRAKKTLPVVLLVGTSIVLSYVIFKMDIFPVGNVLYVEGLYSKSNFRHNFSLFDNVVFKVVLSMLLAVGTLKVVEVFITSLAQLRLRTDKMYILLLLVLNIGLLFMAPDLYERYFIPVWLLFVVLVLTHSEIVSMLNIKTSGFLLLLLCISSMIIQYEFVQQSKLKMNQVTLLRSERSVVSGVNVSGNYVKYITAVEANDYMGNKNLPVLDYSCFVQQYTIESENKLFQYLYSAENSVEEYVDNPSIYASSKNDKIPRIKKNLDKLIYNSEYFSPVYNLVGKKAYVGTWCN